MTIASEISRLQQAKTNIKDAIEGKGVTIGSNVKLDDYYCCINDIQQGGGDLEIFQPLKFNITSSLANCGKVKTSSCAYFGGYDKCKCNFRFYGADISSGSSGTSADITGLYLKKSPNQDSSSGAGGSYRSGCACYYQRCLLCHKTKYDGDCNMKSSALYRQYCVRGSSASYYDNCYVAITYNGTSYTAQTTSYSAGKNVHISTYDACAVNRWNGFNGISDAEAIQDTGFTTSITSCLGTNRILKVCAA